MQENNNNSMEEVGDNGLILPSMTINSNATKTPYSDATQVGND